MTNTLPIVECTARARIPTTHGHGAEIFLHLYQNNIDNKEHLAIVFGSDIRSKTLFEKKPNDTEHSRMTRGAYVGKLWPGRERSDYDEKSGERLIQDSDGKFVSTFDKTANCECGTISEDVDHVKEKSTLVRIHSECYTGENAWSVRCDCGEQFDEAGRQMSEIGRGVIVYLRQEGRGIGLGEKLKAYNLQDLGADTVQANLMLNHPADSRNFGLATSILMDLGIERISLLTNNPDKILAVEGEDRLVKVVERVPMVPKMWSDSEGGVRSKEMDGYLRTKVVRMGHLLNIPITLHSPSLGISA